MQPHPDLADVYMNLRPGDSALDRLHRAETLAKLSSWDREARLALARAALEAREFGRAREVLRPLLDERPTVRACLLMADIEQAEHGVTGQVREWLARAARSPRDPVWIADGVVVRPLGAGLAGHRPARRLRLGSAARPARPARARRSTTSSPISTTSRAIAIPAPTAPQVEESAAYRRSRDGGGGSRARARRAGPRGQRRRQRLGAGAARGGSCGRAGGLSGRPCAGRSRTRKRGREAGPPPPLRLTPASPI